MRVGDVVRCPECQREVRVVRYAMDSGGRDRLRDGQDVSGPREGCTHVCVLSEAAERAERERARG